MNQKERLLRALRREEVDRPPVICPGGMMSACVTEVLQSIEGNHHNDVSAMVSAAQNIYRLTGFENLGAPFCITAECEPFGVGIDLGDKKVEPRITHYNQKDTDSIINDYPVSFGVGSRLDVILEAVKKVKNDTVPVIGNIAGHISTATSVVDPLDIFKMLRKEPDKALRFFEFINDFLIDYAEKFIESGADVIAISDPTATGEILGRNNFEKFVVPFYRKLIDKVHEKDVPVIIHICGNAKNIIELLDTVQADAISFDSMVNMGYARQRLGCALMGNVSTQLLHTGDVQKITSITRNAIRSGVDIISPACGLSMATPVNNLFAMTEYVKKGSYDANG